MTKFLLKKKVVSTKFHATNPTITESIIAQNFMTLHEKNKFLDNIYRLYIYQSKIIKICIQYLNSYKIFIQQSLYKNNIIKFSCSNIIKYILEIG